MKLWIPALLLTLALLAGLEILARLGIRNAALLTAPLLAVAGIAVAWGWTSGALAALPGIAYAVYFVHAWTPDPGLIPALTWSAAFAGAAALGAWRARGAASGGAEELGEPLGHLFELAPEAVVITDFTGRIKKMNELAVRLLGPGKTDGSSTFQDRLPPLHRETFARLLGEAGVSDSWPLAEKVVEMTALRPDGLEFPVELILHRVRLGEQRWMSIFLRDVTSRKSEETRLHQARRMEALGRLAGGVAHDFNNILTAIIGFGELLKAGVADRPDLVAHADEVLKAGELAGTLSRQLLAFSRKQVVVPKVVSLNPILQGMESMFRRVIPENIELVMQPGAGLDLVEVDPAQIQQVLINLVINAKDAMPRGGRLTLRTSGAVVTAKEAALYQHAQPGRHVVLEVADTGQGMDTQTQAHLFEPFFTTKKQSGGTGLGLATSYGIVRQANGHIRIVSDLDRGTTFSVYLPSSKASAAEAAGVPSPQASRKGQETILVVEDSPVILRLAEASLRKDGYSILTARDGQEALDAYGDPSREIQLLLTDIVMPRLSGYDLARKLSASRPNLKVLYMSGYADTTFVSREFFKTQPEFLRKPFTPSELNRKVRAVIDHGQPFVVPARVPREV